MGENTTHGLPYPVGTDRVMDGDNAIQALAEAVDAALWNDPDALAPGIWQASPATVICTATSLAAAPGTSITRARWMKIGNTVWFQGEGSMASAVTDPAVSLPNATAGVPAARVYVPGQCLVTDSTLVAQSSSAIMGASKDRVIPITATGAYVDAPSTSGIRWNVVYEVLPA